MKKQTVPIVKWRLLYEEKAFPVTVPGDIVGDLVANGILADVMFGDNYKCASWVHDRDWVYEGAFTLTKEQAASARLGLAFECIDTFSEITLNGVPLGSTDNMFLQYRFDIRGIAHEGENVVTVKLFSVRERAKSLKNGKYTACFNDERLFIRKAQCHFGWDWAPDFPGTGIAGDVYLEIGEACGICNVQVKAGTDGAAGFCVETFACERTDELRIEVFSPEGKSCGTVGAKVCGGKNLLNLYVGNPALWYPNGYGAQPLYRYTVLLMREGEEVEERTGKFAFRTFEVRETPLGESAQRFDMYANGQRFRAIGSNWVPCTNMFGLAHEEVYKTLLGYAAAAGINMLRVWGGGSYEKDRFYDLCDEYGIVVWQDFMFSCGAVPDDIAWFRDAIEREAASQIVRLRNHPCIGIWCGGNELSDCFRIDYAGYGKYITNVMLPGLCYQLDGTRKYICASPHSSTDIMNDPSSGDCHNNALSVATAHNDIEHYRSYQWGTENDFDSECAVLGMCRLRSFRKFMPEGKLWPQNELWEERLACNPYDDSVVSFTARINMTVEALFGRADMLEEYIKRSMTAHAEVLSDEIDYYRSFERNSGLLNWMYNDIWGNATWAIVDFYGEKKPAYYAMKRAGKRRRAAVVQRKEGYVLSVVNDTARAWEGELDFSHRKLTGEALKESKIPFSLPPFTQELIPVSFDENEKQAFLRLASNEGTVCYFYDLWKDKHFTTNLDLSIHTEGNTARIAVKAREYARCVFIDLPDGVRAELSDNYFDLAKGDETVVTVCADRPLAKEDFTVKTFADRWEE